MTKFFKLLLCCMLVLGLAVVAGCSSTNKASNEKVFRVGMECGYAPFNWTQTNADNGAVQIKGTQEYANGYDVMIAKQIAEAMGAKAKRVETIEEFEAAFKEAVASNEPYLLDCIIDSDDKVWPMVAPGGSISDAFNEEDLEKLKQEESK